MSGALDYIVTKPASFHLTEEEAGRLGFTLDELDWGYDEDDEPKRSGEVTLAHGTRIPGDIAEGWGSGRVVNHLCNNRILAPVPADGEYVAPEPAADEDVESEIPVEVTDELEALKARVAELEAEKAALEEQLEASDGEDTPENEEPGDEINVVGSDEWLSAFDDAEAALAVVEVESWGTGDGDEAIAKPDDDAIRSLLEHEVTHANRGEVLVALEAKLNESPIVPEEPQPATETFPQHKGGGTFILSDGTEVRGKATAVAAQAALDSAGS